MHMLQGQKIMQPGLGQWNQIIPTYLNKILIELIQFKVMFRNNTFLSHFSLTYYIIKTQMT